MCKINKKSVEVKVYEESATDSNTGYNYRYVLIKEWEEANKPVVVIMYNPSYADCLMYDKTVMNVENYFKKKRFNKIIILNLFSIKGKDSSIVNKGNKYYESKNIDYIEKYVQQNEDIYLAWGYGKNKNKPQQVKDKIEEVERIVMSEKKKINTLGRVRAFAYKDQTKLHPQNMNIDTWTDIKYDFSHLDLDNNIK